jgi:DNA-directed RNA polymerase specialized sigma24 family protein
MASNLTVAPACLGEGGSLAFSALSTTTASRLPASPVASATFATTHWTAIVTARDAESPQAALALESLCRAYWYPLYVFVRRQGYNPHDAQDLTQEFFSCLLHKRYLDAADREKGRFRTFLVVALRRFLCNERDRANALKRGGGQVILPLDGDEAEHRYQAEPGPDHSAEKIYDRRWALTLLDRTMNRLRQEFMTAGKQAEFEHLKVFLTTDTTVPAYADLAKELGGTEGAARVAVHRLRKRFREVFREEITQTVDDPENVEEEIRHLLTALAG